MLNGVEDRIRQKMEARGIVPPSIESFLRLVRRLRRETSGHVPLDTVAPPDDRLLLVPPSDLDEMAALESRGRELLSGVVVIKLNGGRSTTMGGEVPKGVLKAKDGLTYLDIILRQTEAMSREWGAEIPLILMNSFFTHVPSMEIVGKSRLPVHTFIQREAPRLLLNTLEPLDTGTEEDWTPLGHGDVYCSFRNSGLLEKMLKQGRRWALISNLDNLAACVEPWILGLIDRDAIELLLEVTQRTDVDRKGGTLVAKNGRLDLLEIAQVAPEDRAAFMDIGRFRVFNTNNVWVDLKALDRSLEEKELTLPIIQNRKHVAGQEVIQVETAMGAAIRAFSRARGLSVGRDRFFPTKNVQDLFVLQSDACVLDSLFRVRKNPLRPDFLPYRPSVVFSPDFLESAVRMDVAFEDASSVSLLEAESLQVTGPVYFERDIKIRGNVQIKAEPGRVLRIPRGTVLDNQCYL